MSLLILNNLKEYGYNLRLAIIDKLIKIINYKLVKKTIDIANLSKAIFKIILRYHNVPYFIINNKSILIILNFIYLYITF